ncbi:MAG: tRNA pseudouridine synthase [Nocardioidaceae bacterium]|nr:tRNA pseudouridine synthase [Nocardioidaceae bacterium]
MLGPDDPIAVRPRPGGTATWWNTVPVRLRIDLAYDGTGFHGWARQPGLRTVQGDLEDALDTVLRVSGTTSTVAGRTDTGVHARGLVLHVDVDDARLATVPGRGRDTPLEAVLRRLNGILANDVRLTAVREAAPGFDARFSALWRRYTYRIADHVEASDPLQRGHVLFWPRPLDDERMNEAAALLLGEHDFAAFCRKREGATTIRSLVELRCSRDPVGMLVLDVRADAFCHSMVSSLTGCLMAVGEGLHYPEWAADVLTGRRRDPGVRVARAHGLTLEQVGYPSDDELAAQAVRARVVRTL